MYSANLICTWVLAFATWLASRTAASGAGSAAHAARTYFYIGGRYETVTQPISGSGQVWSGQIYVEKIVPPRVTKKYPLVFIPGAGQTSTNYLSTPDRREGWADYFLKRGYVVYLTDPPQRGRSPWIPGEGFVEAVPVDYVLRFFTTAQKYKLWPQAYLNAQWPGTGLPGDPIFDEFYRSQVQLQLNASLSDVLNKPADEALLDRIGPAVVVTHSQSGPYGWVIGDSRPNLVKGIIAVEPEGPPFVNETGPTGPARYDGITRLPLKYDPPVVDPFTDLKTEVIPPAGPNLTSCTQQKAPVKKLVNLSKVPVLLLTGEASYHAPYDYCMVRYLRQVGINVRWLDLGAVGIHGNGHFLFMEKNNRKIAGLVGKWLREVVEKH